MIPTLNAEEWMRILEKVAAALTPQGTPVKLCLIDSAACLFGGMDGRTSADLDVWRPQSDYDRAELRAAAEAAGLLFDPKSALEPEKPYLQIVEPGLTQLGAFEPVLVDRIGRLEIYRPPVENLIAAKLIRAEPKDISDIRFLVALHRPDALRIRAIVATLPAASRERAEENLVYLEVLTP
jgi:hypothetical protein